MRYTVRAKGSDEAVASSPEPGAEFTLGDGHCLKVGLTPAPTWVPCTACGVHLCVASR